MAKRQIFYSFHFDNDVMRVQQVRNIGALEGNEPVSVNAWEEVKKRGKASIEKWIDDNMKCRSCVVVLVGSETANRPWVKYEVEKAWKDGKGVVGVYIHNLKDSDGRQSSKGANPFASIPYGNTGKMLSSIIKTYDPPYSSSTSVYEYIKENLADWVEEAISIRNKA